MSTSVSASGLHAAQLRKLVRRELRRVDAIGLHIYVHGSDRTIRLFNPSTGNAATAPVAAALASLRALPDHAGEAAAVNAITDS